MKTPETSYRRSLRRLFSSTNMSKTNILPLLLLPLLLVLVGCTKNGAHPSSTDHGTEMAMSTPTDGSIKIETGMIQRIGVRIAPVKVEALAHEIRATGRFVMDEQAQHTITIKTAGYVENLHADFNGMKVSKGDRLFDLYSPELVASQEELITAFEYLTRLQESAAEPENVSQAQRVVNAARKRLRLWDLSETVIEEIEQRAESLRLIPFYAPVGGEIMNKNVTEGAFVRAGQKLMDIVGTSKTWLFVDIFEQDLPWVEIGTPARVELPYDPSFVYEGEIEYIYHMLNEELRAVRARIVLPSHHHSPFKPGMFATVFLEGAPDIESPVVPSEALVRDGRRELVILSLGEGRFLPVPVRAGRESNGWIQILEGLEGNEEVVVSAQFLLDSEARLGSAVMAMQNMDM